MSLWVSVEAARPEEAHAASDLELFFEPGKGPWYVCQGYNGTASHYEGKAGAIRLDLITNVDFSSGDPAAGGACNGAYASSSNNAPVVSPVDGTIAWPFNHNGPNEQGVCIDISGTSRSIKLTHLKLSKTSGSVTRGQTQLGTVTPHTESKSGMAHIDVAAYDSNSCQNGGGTLQAFTSANGFKFRCVKDLPYDPTVTNQHANVKFAHCSGLTDPADLKDGDAASEKGDTKVYVIAGGAKYHISSSEELNNLGYTWDDVKTVPEGGLASFGKYSKDGTDLREWDDDTWFRVAGQAKYHIRPSDVDGLNASPTKLPDGAMNRYGKYSVDGTDLREWDDSSWFRVAGQAKYHIRPSDVDGLNASPTKLPDGAMNRYGKYSVDGTDLREWDDNAWFLIAGRAKFHLQPSDVEPLNASPTKLPAGAMNRYGKYPLDGTVLQAWDDSTPYLTAGQAKFAVEPSDVDPLNANPVTVPANGLNRFGDIPIDGTLLRRHDASQVWLVEDGKRRPVSSYDENSVVVIPSGGLEQIPELDLTPPETSISSSPDTETEERTATFEFTSSEPGSSFECRLDGGSWSSCTSPHTVDGLSTGRHEFQVRATDDAGNVDPTPATHTWEILPAVESDSTGTGRLAGVSRFDTAVAISQAQFPNGAAIVYLARAYDPLVDAVAGGSLTGGPTLLVPDCGEVPSQVVEEINRLNPSEVIALGGAGAICDQTLVDAAGERPTSRLAGVSRFDTAVAISQAQFPDGAAIVYLARAYDPLVDAVAGGSLTGGPTLLVPDCGEVPSQVLVEINRLNPSKVIALGGNGAICDQTVAESAGGRATGRLAGVSRFDTAVAISQAQFPDGAAIVYLARAYDPLVDAVAGGSLTGGPTLLVPDCGEVPSQVLVEINRLNPSKVIALGGNGAICDQTLTDAMNS